MGLQVAFSRVEFPENLEKLTCKGDELNEAKDLFKQNCNEDSLLSYSQLIELLEDIYDDYHVPFDRKSVEKWVDMSMQSFNRAAGSAVTLDEYLIFYGCCSVFAKRKAKDYQNGLEKLPEYKKYVFLGGSCDPTTWRFDVAIP